MLLTIHISELRRSATWPKRHRHCDRGRQYRSAPSPCRMMRPETLQTMWLLRRELARHGLIARRMFSDSVLAAPTLLIERTAPSLAAGTASRL